MARASPPSRARWPFFFCILCTLVTGPRRSLGPHLSDKRVYEPYIRARRGTTAHFCKVVVLKFEGQVCLLALPQYACLTDFS